MELCDDFKNTEGKVVSLWSDLVFLMKLNEGRVVTLVCRLEARDVLRSDGAGRADGLLWPEYQMLVMEFEPDVGQQA